MTNAEYQDFIRQAEAMAGGKTLLPPQPGFQATFLNSPADIAIGGGSAGGGKTFALLMECIRHARNPLFSGIVFRRLMPEILNAGGLWEEAQDMFGTHAGGEGVLNPPTWHFPHPQAPSHRGAKITFRHLQYEKDVNQHHGGQYPFIGFDELAHFTQKQFWYLLSRNRTRTDVGFRPYMRCTTNPESSGWLKELISWWIYPDNHPDENKAGFPIPERQGVLRYFVREGGTLFFANSKKELIKAHPHFFNEDYGIKPEDKIKSLTFIGGSVKENLALLKRDPGYVGSLMALPEADRKRLLAGCWKYTPGDDELFEWAAIQDLFSNDFIDDTGNDGRFITADIAMEGADAFVVMVWYGWTVVEIKMYEKTNSKMVLSILRETASRHRVHARNIAYDKDGVGDFVGGFFRTSYGFRGNASPIEQPEKAKSDIGKKRLTRDNFENLRAQVYFTASKDVQNAEAWIKTNEVIRQRLTEELQATRKASTTSSGKLRVIPKADIIAALGRSPDLADAFVMRWVFKFRKRRRRVSSSTG